MRKIILILTAIAGLSAVTFAQETAVPETAAAPDSAAIQTTTDDSQETEQESEAKIKKTRNIDFFLCFEPALIINTRDTSESAVSPIVYPISFGAVFFKTKPVTFQPRLSFFANYYLWENDKAYPAEIENRTAAVFSFLLDLPAVYTLNLKEKHHMDFAFGPAFNFRIITLANGVSGSDAGSTGTADGDVSEIRSYLWGNGNFVYLSTYTSYLYSVSDRLQVGPEFRFYISCGQLFSGNGFDSSMLSLGIKAKF